MTLAFQWALRLDVEYPQSGVFDVLLAHVA